MSYEAFVSRKLTRVPPTGIEDATVESEHLFEFQRLLVQWALRRGRCAIFADTGMGKSRMQVTWADRIASHTGKPVLILAPLAVGHQTAAEAESCGIQARVVKDGSEILTTDRIVITNYERLHRFDTTAFSGVAADESSILKHHTSKTLAQMIASFESTPFKLCLTATPSPNDYTELGTHAEFLGICKRTEMLAEYFVHDGGETQKWRLKGHARQVFWRFIASWAALVRSPADLGFDASSYQLPPLNVNHHVVDADDQSVRDTGLLFASKATSLMERRAARKGSLSSRVSQCADRVNASDGRWIVWCDLNQESVELTKSVRGAVELTGSMDVDDKERVLSEFIAGKHRVLVSKPSLAGFGLNLQFCSRMAFVGVTDSWEAYYQAVRRIYRFGQSSACEVHIYASELEGAVVANLQRKEADAKVMADELSRETSEMVRAAVTGTVRQSVAYLPSAKMKVPGWAVGG